MEKPCYETPRVELLQIQLEKGFASSAWDDPSASDFDLIIGGEDNEFA